MRYAQSQHGYITHAVFLAFGGAEGRVCMPEKGDAHMNKPYQEMFHLTELKIMEAYALLEAAEQVTEVAMQKLKEALEGAQEILLDHAKQNKPACDN